MKACYVALLGLFCWLFSGSKPVTPLSILVLGDSYSIGEGVTVAERWPNQLVARLQAQSYSVHAPEIIATTGWTTTELSAALQQATFNPPYDLVFLLIGVNNQYRGLPLAQYQVEFQALLLQAVSFAGQQPQRVVVLSIPDWGVTPFAAGRDRQQISQEIVAFNGVNQQITLATGAHYVDITPISRQAETEPGLLTADGLHPAGGMYQQWVAQMWPVVVAILGVHGESGF